MSRRVCLVVMALSLVFSSRAWAAVTTSVSFAGTIPSPPTAGACSTSSLDYDYYCPSGDCECEEFTGVLSWPLVGKDKNAHLDVTIDLGATTTGSDTKGCVPFFAVMNFHTTREMETDDITGTICSTFRNSLKDTVSGGLGIESSTAGADGGWGTVSGTINQTKTPWSLKISSKVHIPNL